MIASESDNTHTTEPMSLSSLPGLRRPDYEGNRFDDCSSYYSLSKLSETDPVRRVLAVEVRRQALAIPPKPRQDCKYPELLRNDEAMPLRVHGPWLEYPLLETDRYISGIPGPARVVISAGDYAGFDVIYHPTWGQTKFVHANYRPKGYHSALLNYFMTQSGDPVYPSMITNGYPMPCQFDYAVPQGLEWQCQGFGQALWPTAESQWAQPCYDMQMQSQYERCNGIQM
ncbi:hypothetical protein LCI18_014372 [Fusarium solani-melongenae]|uniref:Uncharacterized protein n=1 Tax=Fusarium solani subsp. cucurbitae TaxID=2747967 RepID=A0ACD3ZR58_FUSSC|nr:hypothetical protein LCI18_014372 [Fusarium solani-melongenae]